MESKRIKKGSQKARQQRLQRDMETRNWAHSFPSGWPRKQDLPLLHRTATATTENRLDGIIWKAEHSQLLESHWSWYPIDETGVLFQRRKSPITAAVMGIIIKRMQSPTMPSFTSGRGKPAMKASYWHLDQCGFPSQALLARSGLCNFLCLRMMTTMLYLILVRANVG